MQHTEQVLDQPFRSHDTELSELKSRIVSAESRSRLILAAIVAFRDGDFSVRLPADWTGMDARIAEAFNQAIAHEDHISREVARLSVTVGKEGRLSSACRCPGRSADGRRRSNRSTR